MTPKWDVDFQMPQLHLIANRKRFSGLRILLHSIQIDFAATPADMANDTLQQLRTQFGRLVSSNRRNKGWTQEHLASQAEISVDMISRLEAGATGARFTTIDKLATALGVGPEELFSPATALSRPRLNAVITRLARLSDDDLEWLDDVLAAVLKHR